MSATISEEVETLAKPLLHNPYILTLSDNGNEKDDIVSKNIQQYYIKCSSRDKLVHILALLKLELVQKKVLIFTNTIDMSFRLKLFLEQFGIKSAVFNSELPLNSRKHIIEGFSAGLFDYMIATDDDDPKEKEQDGDGDHAVIKKCRRLAKDNEAGVARGIDFKNVNTVINFDMPQSAVRYIHRIGGLEEHTTWVNRCLLLLPRKNMFSKKLKLCWKKMAQTQTLFPSSVFLLRML